MSGVYLGKLSTLPALGGQYLDREMAAESYFVFVLRDDRKADLLFQTSDMTWLSYNRWPQWRSLYDLGTNPWGANNRTVGYDVSFDKPYALFWNGFPAGFHPLTNGSGEFLMTEFPLAFWLEREGFDVTYISNVDTHTDGPGLLRGKAFLSVGHDEYWTQQMFDNVVQGARCGRQSRVSFGQRDFRCGRTAAGSDGRPNRVMRRSGRAFEGEQELMGGSSYGVGFTDWTCDKPEHWVFEGTNMKKGDRVAQLVGWEYHGPPLGKHPDLVVLSKVRSTATAARSAPGPTRPRCTRPPRATWCSMPRPAGGTCCYRRRRVSRTRRARTSHVRTAASSGSRRISSTG